MVVNGHKRIDNSIRNFKISFLLFHLCVAVQQFYEIIFNVEDDSGSYEILFRKIHRGLMVTVSLFSYFLYICCTNGIESTRQKLRKIDFIFESIAVKECELRNGLTLRCIICTQLVLIILYFYARCLRGRHFYAYANFVAISKDSAIHTYFVIVNAFIALNFARNISDGKNRFVRINRHFNNKIGTGRYIVHMDELNEMNWMYYEIIDYCDSVRMNYQLPIFMILISDMFAITYMILTAFHEFVSKSIPMSAVLFCLVDPLVRIIQTVIVVSTAEGVISQIRRWSDTLQRMMIESEMNTNLKERVSLFLMEMVDKKLVFVMSGFFKLSHETLVAMMGTVSTYLLIMMQFRPLEDGEEGSRTAKLKLF